MLCVGGGLVEIVLSVLSVLGIVMTIITIFEVVVLIIACVKGFFPTLMRFGINRSKLKIAIVASDTGNFEEIKQTLTRSKLIHDGNIEQVTLQTVRNVDQYSALIVHEDAIDALEDIARCISSKTCLIIYAPKKHLSEKQKQILQTQPISTLVNFRGRLLADTSSMLVSAQNVKK